MRSEPDENAAVLPHLMAVDRRFVESSQPRRSLLDAFGEDRAAVREFTRWTRPSAILIIALRVAVVGGVLAALELAV